MMHNWTLFLAVLLLVSCKEPEARRPVTQKTSTILTETLNQNKKLIAAETKMIENYIALDSTKTYLTSSFGFVSSKKAVRSLVSPVFLSGEKN